MFARHLTTFAVLMLAGTAPAQLRMGPRMSPGGAPVLDSPTPQPVAATDVLAPPAGRAAVPADVLAGTAARGGQQHWVSLNLGVLQPTTARLGVKVWDRPNGSLWLELYGGSVLVDAMYGFGARMQFTAKQFGNGDQLMIAPGLGTHVLPTWQAATRRYYESGYSNWGYHGYEYKRSPLYFLVADVDISWLHDFSPHFGYEIGLKLGIGGRVGGEVGKSYPRGLMFSRDFYPVVSVYTGLRF